MTDELTCERCGRRFSVPEGVLRRYPGWKPKVCLRCRSRENEAASTASRPAATPSRQAAAASPPRSPPASALLPLTIYTDGACQGNPGPGGWGMVAVRGSTAVEERQGFEQTTTNNRMELRAIIEALRLAPPDEAVTIYTDSNLMVQTLNQWARSWEQRGWRRKEGEVKNLELVQEAWGLLKQRPNVRIEWVAGHAGNHWNEHADALATGRIRQRAGS